MAGVGKLTKLFNTANKAFKATRKNAGKLVQTAEKNGQTIQTYEKQVGKYNPFRRTKTVTSRFVEGEANPTRVTVQRQKGSVFQTVTEYDNGKTVASQVNVKTGKMEYLNARGNTITKQARTGLDKTHTDNFTRNWAIGGTTGTIAGVTAYALLGNEDEAAEPIAADKAETTEPEEETTAAADSTETAEETPEAAAAPAAQNDSTQVAAPDSTATAPVVAPVPADSTATVPTDSTQVAPVAPADSTANAPTAPVAPADSTATTQPAQPAAPQQPAPAQPAQPAQQNPPTNNIFGGALNQVSIKDYKVVKGDCLWNIAKHELQKANPGATITNAHILEQVKEFIRLNPQIKNPDLIYPDQQIKLAA
ncbi:MAG: LysM peptidoglycan-binding domain-containing protein [Fusobacterium sp.]|nr:LysM peptidoglycan-binding domain-containing protein [Fusobacterium sp.]